MTILSSEAPRGPEIWCRCDGGPLGFLSIAAHGHADALSVEVRYDGVEVLVDPGTYCFRPAFVKHGHFVAEEDTTWIIRSDGELINWYTTDEWIKWGGDAENYEPHQAPVPSTLPIRSRSGGAWYTDGM